MIFTRLASGWQTKKRYVGFMYETPDQQEPVYDAKGIETVRRDGCPAVAKVTALPAIRVGCLNLRLTSSYDRLGNNSLFFEDKKLVPKSMSAVFQ